MPAAAVLPIPAGGASSRRNRRQTLPPPGLLVSLVLHGGVLAFIAGWNGGAADVPKGIEVSIMMERAVEEPSSMIAAAPPSASPIQARSKPSIQPRPAVRNGAAGPARRPAPPVPDMAPPDMASSGAGPAATPRESGTGDSGRIAGEPGGGLQGGQPDGAAADRPAAPSAGNPAPVYPMVARRASREGRTVLLVSVEADGACGDVRIEVSSGTPSLDAAAMAAVRHWRFTPARQAGKMVSSTIRVPVLFRLTGNS